MKKIICVFVLILTICGSVLPCFSEQIDISQYSDEALLDIYNVVYEEIESRGIDFIPDYANYDDETLFKIKQEIEHQLADRGINDDYIHPGVYVVGEDIRPGTVIFTALSPDKRSYTNISIYDKDTYDPKMWTEPKGYESMYYGQTCQLTLSDGSVLKIEGGALVSFRDTAPSWAP